MIGVAGAVSEWPRFPEDESGTRLTKLMAVAERQRERLLRDACEPRKVERDLVEDVRSS